MACVYTPGMAGTSGHILTVNWSLLISSIPLLIQLPRLFLKVSNYPLLRTQAGDLEMETEALAPDKKDTKVKPRSPNQDNPFRKAPCPLRAAHSARRSAQEMFLSPSRFSLGHQQLPLVIPTPMGHCSAQKMFSEDAL